MRPASARVIRRKLAVAPRFCDIDMMGVVHNSVYIQWFDEGRHQFVNEIVPVEDALQSGLALVVVENTCKYKAPVRLGDTLMLITTHRRREPHNGRFEFDHSLVHTRTKAIMAEGQSTLVPYDLNTHRLVNDVPEDIWARYLAMQ
jgi:YbgC/YbaW family acyl-CoA thioester hydrolase